MGITRILIAGAAFAVSALAAGEAKADYVCSVTYYPGNGTTAGSEGLVSFGVYSGPACTGTFVGSYYLCTGGASANACSNFLLYRYERAGLIATFTALQRAAADDQRVTVSTTSQCYAGGTSCLASVKFHAD